MDKTSLPFFTTAAAVSSQELSMAKNPYILIYPAFHHLSCLFLLLIKAAAPGSTDRPLGRHSLRENLPHLRPYTPPASSGTDCNGSATSPWHVSLTAQLCRLMERSCVYTPCALAAFSRLAVHSLADKQIRYLWHIPRSQEPSAGYPSQ